MLSAVSDEKCFSPHLVLVVLAILLGAQGVDAQKRRAAKPAPRKSKTVTPVNTPQVKPPSTREEEILAEINLARANPVEYAGYLEAFKPNYNGKQLTFSDGKSLVTNEGVSACDEAIVYLRSLKPLAPLEMSAGLVLRAKDHVGDLVKTGGRGHKGSDGSVPEDRVSRYGTWSESVGEDILYDSRKAREDVISLIIDDGVATRGHRKNIFKPTFHVMELL
ncbi:MAG: CAP domain-containing protein [Acidobacteriota bacterium]|nr:CAP domain-containing protein [Acidobacteriota bacterium]